MFRNSIIAFLLMTTVAHAEIIWVDCGDDRVVHHYHVHHFVHHVKHHVYHGHKFHRHHGHHKHCHHVRMHRLCPIEVPDEFGYGGESTGGIGAVFGGPTSGGFFGETAGTDLGGSFAGGGFGGGGGSGGGGGNGGSGFLINVENNTYINNVVINNNVTNITNNNTVVIIDDYNCPCEAKTIPEPSTWAMMILGFIGVTSVGYWKRKKLA